MNKNILMICYYFPPLTDVGAKRSVAFAKYFKKNSWQPHIISVKNPDKSYCTIGNENPPNGVNTVYTRSIFNLSKISGLIHGLTSKFAKLIGIKEPVNYFYQFFCIPDIFWGWIPATVKKALKLIKNNNIDVIYVTCTPYTSAIIGIILKKITGKKLIIDFRDQRGIEKDELWDKKFPIKIRKNIEKKWVKKSLEVADLFIVTSEEIKSRFIQAFPFVKNKIHTVYNGFDSDFMPDVGRKGKKDKFTIIYTGDFYFYSIKSLVFFEALALLKKEKEINQTDFNFLYYGDAKEEIIRYANDFSITDLISANGRVPYNQVLEEIQSSHLQLIRIVPPMISTKVFEGIPLNVPFLATIQSTEVENIINQFSPSSSVIVNNVAREVADAILCTRDSYKQNIIENNKSEDFLKKYSRESQTEVLISLIEKELIN